MRTLLSSWLRLLAAAIICFATIPFTAVADSITLNTGEVLEGQITSETDKQIQIEIKQYGGTITATRSVAKTDIKSINRESPEAKQEKAAYEALTKYNLDPNQELIEQQYDQWIAAFERFLATYPNSAFADTIRQRHAQWQDELSHVKNGQVKFGGKWMSPAEKKTAYEIWRKQHAVEDAAKQLAALKKRLTQLETQRNQLSNNLVRAQGNLDGANVALQNARQNSHQEPVSSTTPSSGHWSGVTRVDPKSGIVIPGGTWINNPGQTFISGYRTVPDPQIPSLEQNVSSYQSQLTQGRQSLASLNSQISDTTQKIPTAEHAYNDAVARHEQELAKQLRPVIDMAMKASSQEVVAVQSTVVQPRIVTIASMPSAPSAVPKAEPSWLETHWSWLLGGGFVLVFILLALLTLAAGTLAVGRSRLAKENVGEAMVANTLSRFGRPHVLLNNVTLPVGDGTTQIDHILVADTGIFVIETKHYTGWIYGKPSDDRWTQVIFHIKNRFRNPLRQNYGHLKAVKALLNLPETMFAGLVVFTGDAEFKTDLGNQVVHLEELLGAVGKKRDVVFDEQKIAFVVGILEMRRCRRSLETDEYHLNYVQKKIRAA